jgi:hypothetical protein
MLQNCLENFIGIRGLCEDITPDSNLYLNDLPQISIKMVADISDSDHKNFSGVLESCRNLAFAEFQSDMMLRTQEFFKTNVLLEKSNSGQYQEPYTEILKSAKRRGLSIKIRDNVSDYLSIFVNTVQLYFKEVKTVDIVIYNSLNGFILDTISHTSTVGMNRININKSYPTYGQDTNIFISYDATDIDTIEVDNNDDSSIAIVQGGSIDIGQSVIDTNISTGNESYGMVVNYNIQCDISEFICSNRDLLKFAIWWKYGEAIMFERMTSTRLNKFTLSKTPEEIKELWEYYGRKYAEIMDSIVPNIDKSSDGICFTCSRQRSYKFLRP